MYNYNSFDEIPPELRFIPILFISVAVIIIIIMLVVFFFSWITAPRRRQKNIMYAQRATYRENLRQSQMMQAQLQHQQQTTLIQELERLSQLKDNGHISEEEYNNLKNQLLSK